MLRINIPAADPPNALGQEELAGPSKIRFARGGGRLGNTGATRTASGTRTTERVAVGGNAAQSQVLATRNPRVKSRYVGLVVMRPAERTAD